MSFQAYITNITKITQKTPEQIKSEGLKTGILKSDMNASNFCAWLNQDYGLGQGHAMALWKYFVEKKWVLPKHSKIIKK
jgi:hypothetical protein